jgi:hypothetical protein
MTNVTDRVKILFEYDGAIAGPPEVESVWAIPTADGFRLDNIPFFAREIAAEDIVSASVDADGMLRFSSLVSPSGHSTVRLWFAKGLEADVQRVRQELRDLGCPSELSYLPRLVAVDIPPTVPYANVRELLDNYERRGVFEYEEACLGQGSES